MCRLPRRKNGFLAIAIDPNKIERLAAIETMLACGCGGYVFNLLFRCRTCDIHYHYQVQEHWPSSSEDYFLYRVEKDEALQMVQELKQCRNLDDRSCGCDIHRNSERMRLVHGTQVWTQSIPQSWN